MGHLDVSRKEFERIFRESYKENPNKILCVIDIGCGNAENREFFKQLNINWMGIDIVSAEGVLKCKMEDLPFPDHSVSYVFSSHSLEHSENPLQALREFKRVLSAGGTLFINTPYPSVNQIMNMDKTHIFVLYPIQIMRLLYYTGLIPMQNYVIKEDETNEDTWHIITTAKVIT